MVPRISLHTLGCKVNQYDSAAMGKALEDVGCRIVDSAHQADVVVVNTCTVTGSTDRQNRQLIRRLRRVQPGALMVVTGCQAEVFPAAIERMSQVDMVVGNRRKDDLPRLILEALDGDASQIPGRPSKALGWGTGIDQLPGHTRAFLKVQDGCEAHCTYCMVPLARGASRSRPLSSILDELTRMERAGVQEVVLTGIRLGLYGRDQTHGISLAELLEHVLEGCTIPRIRLSSLEPLEINGALIGLMRDSERICPHLHVPLQSGHDEVLSWMNRPYRSEEYRDRVLQAFEGIKDLTLGCDVMVGFPGETRAHFQRTFQFLKEIPFTYLHVFPFSPRPGTRACEMPHQVSSQELKRRSQILRELSQVRLAQVMEAHVARTMQILVEQPWPEGKGRMLGLTSNYLRVRVPGDEKMRNRIVPVRLQRVEGSHMVGIPL